MLRSTIKVVFGYRTPLLMLALFLQVRFSIPEHHQPIPKAVAYVFFFLTVPKSQFSNAPVEVFYMMETSRMRHVPGKTSFQEKWLIDIVNVKLKFWREIKF
ncbi:A-kinase anchor protein 14-like [Pollicipes pollicipes]|uniref:A-kinase anchor protein 14-like n=1 Tax=Pollicipes pollicipes TaxID=41117 RepID=UPI0018859D40|nr:A-kinase anchor protein 14-like [Pollicipes pollicipes]